MQDHKPAKRKRVEKNTPACDSPKLNSCGRGILLRLKKFCQIFVTCHISISNCHLNKYQGYF